MPFVTTRPPPLTAHGPAPGEGPADPSALGEHSPESYVLPDHSLLRIIVRVLRGAPAATKVFVALTPVALVALTVVAVVNLVETAQPTARVQVWSLLLGNAGLLLWSLAAVLHAVSESQPHREAASSANALFRRIWQRCLVFTATTRGPAHRYRFHDIVLVLPVIAVTAGCLLAAAAGILLPAIPDSPLFIAPALMYAIFAILAIRTVRDAVRFLYGYAREQVHQVAEARSQATEAQLSALKAQLNPHFLFNALNTVASLVRTDPTSAESTVDNLAQVLRRTLDRAQRTLSSVEDEVDYVAAYLSIEKARFGDRLTVVWNVAPDTRRLKIPPMTLQPLVENSIKHGIGGRLHGGTVTIETAVQDGALSLEVSDDGEGFAPHHREGTGLSNLRNRLQTMYGDRATLEISGNGTGATVRVRVPAEGQELG